MAYTGRKYVSGTDDFSDDPVIKSIAIEINNSGILGKEIVEYETAKKFGLIDDTWAVGSPEKYNHNQWTIDYIFKAYRYMHGMPQWYESYSRDKEEAKAFEEAFKNNPELKLKIDEIVNKANYRVMQLQREDILADREKLKEKPAWQTAIHEGLKGGLSGYNRSQIQSGVGQIKTVLSLMGADTTDVDALGAHNAQQWQGEMALGQYNVSLGTGDPGVASTIYDVSSGFTMMLPDLWKASLMPAPPTNAGKALTVWGKIWNKLKLGKNMAPFFSTSFGTNLMQGELEGKGDTENMVSSAVSAYFESVLEQSIGFFNKTPVKKLATDGLKKLSMNTIKNIGLWILDKPLGEVIEENLQNISSNTINHAMGWLLNQDYDPKKYGDIINPEEMWQTTKTTFFTTMLLSIFDVAPGSKAYPYSQKAEAKYNAAIEAYENGDMDEFNALIKEFTKEAEKALENMEEEELNPDIDSEGEMGDNKEKGENEGSSKIPWNSWQNYEKVTVNGQVYAKVGDRLYTKHAVDRMQPSGNRFGPYIYQAGGDYGRSVAPQFVEDVISSTKPVYQPITGNYEYVSGTIKIITDANGFVITIITISR